MSKQRLESDLRNTLNNKYSNYYFLKLFNHPVTHQTTPSDFLLLGRYENFLIECKETSGTRFSFSRFKQLTEAIEFEEKFDNNYAFFLIMFYSGKLATSDIYMIPVKTLKAFILTSEIKSLSKLKAASRWPQHKIEVLKGGILNLDKYI